VRISAKIDYSLRAAAELAAAPQGDWIRSESIAQAQDISVPFLLNILAELRAAGIVDSRRGSEGGYRLARPAGSITLADVVRAIDGPLATIAGQLPEDIEYNGAAVALRSTWVALRVGLRSVLEVVTLADLASGHLPEQIDALTRDQDAWRVRK
jgi:Rrf2 family protein